MDSWDAQWGMTDWLEEEGPGSPKNCHQGQKAPTPVSRVLDLGNQNMTRGLTLSACLLHRL